MHCPLAFVGSTFTSPNENVPFSRGDTNADGTVDISDPISNLGYQFLASFEPTCTDALDFNDDGEVDVTDPIASLTYQFLNGQRPEPPFPGCGPDPTDDDLGCDEYTVCE